MARAGRAAAAPRRRARATASRSRCPAGRRSSSCCSRSPSLGAAAAPLNPAYAQSEFAFYLEDLQPRACSCSARRPRRRRAPRPARRCRSPTSSLRARQAAGARGRRRATPASSARAGRPTTSRCSCTRAARRAGRSRCRCATATCMASARSIARHYELGRRRRVVLRDAALPRARARRLDARAARRRRHGRRPAPRRAGRFWPQLGEHGVDLVLAPARRFHQMLLDARARATRPTERACASSARAAPRSGAELADAPRGVPRRADARGVRHDRGEPRDGRQPAAARAARARLGRRPDRRRDRIVDDAGASLPPGQPGEVVIRGPGVTAGYLGERRGQRATRSSASWFRTGDQGVLEDGYLRLVGPAQGDHHPRRREHLAARGRGRAARPPGRRARPSCTASRTTKYGQVVGAAVVARRPDARRGRRCGATAASAWPRSRCPCVVHVVDAIPRTPTGKVQRPRMAAALRGGLMRVAIVGAGAIGAYVGAALARGGVGRRPDRPRRAARGASAATACACSRRAATCTSGWTPPTSSTPCAGADLVVLGVKAYSLPGAGARASRRCSTRDAAVLPAQNGVPWWFFQCLGGPLRGHGARDASTPAASSRRAIEPRRVVGCVPYPAAEIVAPGVDPARRGHALHDRRAGRRRSASAAGHRRGASPPAACSCPVEEDVRRRALAEAGRQRRLQPDDRADRRDAGRARARRRRALELARAVMEECAAVGRCARHRRCRSRSSAGSRARIAVGDHRTSMLQDLESGKPLEIECMTGAVLEIAERVGVAGAAHRGARRR